MFETCQLEGVVHEGSVGEEGVGGAGSVKTEGDNSYQGSWNWVRCYL